MRVGRQARPGLDQTSNRTSKVNNPPIRLNVIYIEKVSYKGNGIRIGRRQNRKTRLDVVLILPSLRISWGAENQANRRTIHDRVALFNFIISISTCVVGFVPRSFGHLICWGRVFTYPVPKHPFGIPPINGFTIKRSLDSFFLFFSSIYSCVGSSFLSPGGFVFPFSFRYAHFGPISA